VIVKVVVAPALLPALSVADAVSVCCPAPKDHPAPEAVGHELDAIPERLSVAVHVIATGARIP
jgi:hypothetical protein